MTRTRVVRLGACVLIVAASFVAGELAGSESRGAAHPTGPAQLISVPMSDATPCSGSQPDNFVGESMLNFNLSQLPKGVSLSLIYVPSYDPAGVITSQWPEECDNFYGAHYRQYLFVSNGPVPNLDQVLPLAIGRPVSAECVEKTYPTEDGNAYPLLCKGSHVNVPAWIFYAEGRSGVMRLGRLATRCQVVVAMEGSAADTRVPAEESFTLPETQSSAELAHAYYGWKFAVPDLALDPPRWLSSCGASVVRNWPG